MHRFDADALQANVEASPWHSTGYKLSLSKSPVRAASRLDFVLVFFSILPRKVSYLTPQIASSMRASHASVGTCGTLLHLELRRCLRWIRCSWAAAKEVKLSYYNEEAPLCTIYPYSGNLNPKPYIHKILQFYFKFLNSNRGNSYLKTRASSGQTSPTLLRIVAGPPLDVCSTIGIHY